MTSVIVLCGGLGSRLGPAGAARQKVMFPVCGTPLLELVLTQLLTALPPRSPIVLLAGHRGDDVREAVPGWRRQFDARIDVVAEIEPGPVGVLDAIGELPGPVVIIAGNVLLPYPRLLPAMIGQWEHHGRPVVAGSRQWRTEGHHTVNADRGSVTSWHRLPHRDGGLYEVLDTYLVTRDVIAMMSSGPTPISHTRALAAYTQVSPVAFAEFDGDWLHVQTLADLDITPERKALLCPP